MGLLSIFKRQAESTRSVPDSSDAVQQARTRARRRLIGAAVLLGIGIVGFPLVFETQPRPIPVNIPIEAPAKDGAPALAMPAARTAAPSSSPPVVNVTPPKPVVAAPAEVITESREEAGHEVVAPTPAPAAPASAVVAPKPAAPRPVTAAPVPKPTADAKPADAARAQALLEDKPAKPEKPTEAGRFVVQVGAFADATAARETRLKVEKLGLKTYTQVAVTAAGNRIRVRAGPFASRAEADKAMARAQAAGLTAVVLTL